MNQFPMSSWWPVPGPDPPTERLEPICPSSRGRDDDVLKEKYVPRILELLLLLDI